MKPKVETIVGLDIGSYSVKCVTILRGREKIELHRATILPVADPQSLPRVLKVLDIASAKRIRIAVSGSSILMRRITMPMMTANELKSAIRFEAESHIPFPIDDCVLDFQILNQNPAKKQMTVMLVVAKKDFIESRLKMLSEQGIFPEVIDLDIFCLSNAFEVLNSEAEERTYGLLNIGHRVSSLAITHDKIPALVREIPFAGLGITKTLADLRSISEEQADALKIRKSSEDQPDLRKAAEKGLEPLIEEIRHSFDYIENEAGEDVKCLWVSGGGALALGVTEILSQELGCKVAVWDNTKKLQFLGEIDQKFIADRAPELNVALGMTLRDLGGRR